MVMVMTPYHQEISIACEKRVTRQRKKKINTWWWYFIKYIIFCQSLLNLWCYTDLVKFWNSRYLAKQVQSLFCNNTNNDLTWDWKTWVRWTRWDVKKWWRFAQVKNWTDKKIHNNNNQKKNIPIGWRGVNIISVCVCVGRFLLEPYPK